ncbi:hypothetical protein [Vitiosangium sp. GDMCC 1.1324]|uniref:hypothetical protein n=1 Tax=Vitiosangium sp. (strain GDMCC 1.1324) TaxID=2138576 RepID=UPI000D386CD6|nr:hypothetical protein [Vitiosangium sp. GDMCC 1.1324]PTL78206.1 hypothetical protein DAT35_39800 [Vitiosangium sp. GDMCC 1.1324]
MGSSLLQALPPDVRREGERLFDISMWCIGRDVSHADNLLMRRGFTRERIPAGRKGTSAYSGALPGGGALTLWGFGALCRVCGECVYVPRDGFAPSLVEEGRVAWPVFEAAGLGARRDPLTPRECSAARAAVVGLAGWLAGYEEWVVALMGAGWRHECVAARSRKASPVPVERLAMAWRQLAGRIEALERQVVNESFAPLAGA